ncbi:DUF881 domain-containing protein [Phosphitispora sp. TUW77]|uniref:DUF881 domain-containing protein n=1 Tax=Phosphitispora sp. TUW77 TaxID=3152361 RepID=UPI003AB5DE47
MKLEKWHLSITLVCLLFGTLFTSNLKTQLQDFNPMAARNKGLVNVIKTQEQKNHELETEITDIRKNIEEYQLTATAQTELKPLQQELEKLRFLSGLTIVKGPGIIITLNDQDRARSASAEEANLHIIHYTSILYIVNDLRAAGAEAISVNNSRIVSTSDIRCAGNIILVNTHRLAPPYEISAIGNQKLMEEMVRSGEFTTLELSKFPVTLQRKDNIVIPTYKGSYTFNYATPLQLKEGVN